MNADQLPTRAPWPIRPGAWVGKLRQRMERGAPTEAELPIPIGVVTDSAAALPEAWVKDHATYLRVVPMPVMIDAQIFSEGTDDVPTELALGLAMGKSVRTSRPAPGQMVRAYEELAAAGCTQIISIHLSSALSGTVDAARLGAQQSPVPVTVIDSLTVALAEGFSVMDVLEAATAGASIEELTQIAERAAENHVYFAVPSLEQLRKGGRISAVASMLGTLLNVKPILSVCDGHIVATEKIRSHARTLARLVAIAREEAEARGPQARLAVHYFGNESAAEEIVHELAGVSSTEVLMVPVPAVLGAHTGAGVLAVAISGGTPPPPPAPPKPVPPRREPRAKRDGSEATDPQGLKAPQTPSANH